MFGHLAIFADTSSWHLDKEELEHKNELLEMDDEGYPRLPLDVLERRLSKKKAIIRMFVAAIHGMFHVML